MYDFILNNIKIPLAASATIITQSKLNIFFSTIHFHHRLRLLQTAFNGLCSNLLLPVSSFYHATLCIRRHLLSPRVCPSVTLVYCIQTAEDIIKLFLMPSSTMILFFLTPNCRYSIPRGTPSAGVQNTRVGKNLRLLTELAVCLRNGTR